jgi:AbrB family looped-hinge helix DNA binding protein
MGTVVKMDKQGRILIPAAVRKRIGARLFVLEEGGELRLKPIREIRLTELFDSIEVDVEDFTDTHELRRALDREG